MRLGIGATDSMWPKKRRIRLRVLKAVAILRPRRFKGGRNTRCFLGAPGPPAVRPIRRRGPLVGKDFLEVRSDKEPSSFIKPSPFLPPLPRQGERLGGGVTHPVSPPHLTSPPSRASEGAEGERNMSRKSKSWSTYLRSTLAPSASSLGLSLSASP